MKIRQLAPEEASVVEVGMFLLATFAVEVAVGPLRTRNIEARRAYGYIWGVLKNGAAWIAEDDEGIVGSIGLRPQEFWWSDVRFMEDAWFYVRPEKRNGSASRQLLRAAETFCKDAGMPLMLTITNSDDLERKDALYGRLGYERIGSVFMMG